VKGKFNRNCRRKDNSTGVNGSTSLLWGGTNGNRRMASNSGKRKKLRGERNDQKGHAKGGRNKKNRKSLIRTAMKSGLLQETGGEGSGHKGDKKDNVMAKRA